MERTGKYNNHELKINEMQNYFNLREKSKLFYERGNALILDI